MRNVILIHANCYNPTAKGDFAFAGNLARDIQRTLLDAKIDMQVILVSSSDGIPRFIELYGPKIEEYVSIEGTEVGISSLGEFDVVTNKVVAFIDANRCKYSATEIIKRVIEPESKFLFVGNINQPSFSEPLVQQYYRQMIKEKQPKLYESFDDDDILVGSAGVDADRFGIPTITKACDLPPLSQQQQDFIPQSDYGFIYMAATEAAKDYKLIAQYIRLTHRNEYVLVGSFLGQHNEIKKVYLAETSLTSERKDFPKIQFHQALPNRVMRDMVAKATDALVLSTGVTSTLEAMQDRKLTYYQDLSNNKHFVSSYLHAVKSLATDDAITETMAMLIAELSALLFAAKPLNKTQMEKTQDLLSMDSIRMRLVETNQAIIEQASGKIATKLLSFINGPKTIAAHTQLVKVCLSLRKDNELDSPVHDQALRRAAAWGRVFELKVLIKSMTVKELNKKATTNGLTALHWAVMEKQFDCVRLLINAGACINSIDNKGETPLHKALLRTEACIDNIDSKGETSPHKTILSENQKIIELLISEGASPDSTKTSPDDNPKDSMPGL